MALSAITNQVGTRLWDHNPNMKPWLFLFLRSWVISLSYLIDARFI
ncbi:hypothetical protein OENI_260034 [Oenococcus oeni]|nr:hypothetical protein OENI_260034 [Oenococcus oeni]